MVFLYLLILSKALKKISEFKRARNGVEIDNNNLRYFRGSANDLEDISDTHTSLRTTEQINCFKCCSFESSNKTHTKQPSKWKAIKIVIFTTGSFVLTWVPFFIVSTMYVYCDHENNENFCKNLKYAVAGPLAALGFSNSVINPIIYCWWHASFRKNAIRILSKRLEHSKLGGWCLSKNSNSNTSSNETTSPRTTNISSISNLSSQVVNDQIINEQVLH